MQRLSPKCGFPHVTIPGDDRWERCVEYFGIILTLFTSPPDTYVQVGGHRA